MIVASPPRTDSLRLVGFDGDDTLWKSEDYYRDAQSQFERIVARYVDIADVHERLYAIEARNLALFGYGAKGMTLSMLEAAIEITQGRIATADIERLLQIGKQVLQHPVELLPGIRAAVESIAATHAVVLITKGDLFHQEAKVRESGLADLFHRIEIVSEKDARTYARVLSEFDVPASRFAMIGNSLRSDILPVLELGGCGVHMPYHVTWQHERASADACEARRLRTVACPEDLPGAIAALESAL